MTRAMENRQGSDKEPTRQQERPTDNTTTTKQTRPAQTLDLKRDHNAEEVQGATGSAGEEQEGAEGTAGLNRRAPSVLSPRPQQEKGSGGDCQADRCLPLFWA